MILKSDREILISLARSSLIFYDCLCSENKLAVRELCNSLYQLHWFSKLQLATSSLSTTWVLKRQPPAACKHIIFLEICLSKNGWVLFSQWKHRRFYLSNYHFYKHVANISVIILLSIKPKQAHNFTQWAIMYYRRDASHIKNQLKFKKNCSAHQNSGLWCCCQFRC